jgi:hypothetical protein
MSLMGLLLGFAVLLAEETEFVGLLLYYAALD